MSGGIYVLIIISCLFFVVLWREDPTELVSAYAMVTSHNPGRLLASPCQYGVSRRRGETGSACAGLDYMIKLVMGTMLRLGQVNEYQGLIVNHHRRSRSQRLRARVLYLTPFPRARAMSPRGNNSPHLFLIIRTKLSTSSHLLRRNARPSWCRTTGTLVRRCVWLGLCSP